jgi:hypothetical protein
MLSHVVWEEADGDMSVGHRLGELEPAVLAISFVEEVENEAAHYEALYPIKRKWKKTMSQQQRTEIHDRTRRRSA